MLKSVRRAIRRHRDRYGHSGSGSVHTRQASELEVLRHVEKIEEKKRRKNGGRND